MSTLAQMQTVAQLAQLGVSHRQLQVGHAQVAQLQQLNDHMLQQQQIAALQANLSQALFETERIAKRVALTLQQDAFAAAVHAHYWLLRVPGIGPQHFNDVHSKRAWADAIDTLTNTLRRTQAEAQLNNAFVKYVQLTDLWNRHWTAVTSSGGGSSAFENEDNFLQYHRHRAHTGVAFLQTRSTQLKVGGVLVLVFTMLGLIGVAANHGDAGTVLAVLIPGAVAMMILLQRWNEGRAINQNFASQVEGAEQAVAAYRAFMADEGAGVWLTRVWSDHPLLFQEPIPEAGASAAPASSVQTYVERRLVERQIVVTRCKFCKQMTPVDGEVCGSCGAPGFGG